MHYILGFIAFLSLVSSGLAQVSVVAALENNKVLIGDQAVLHLEAKYPDNFEMVSIDLSVLDSIFAEIDTKNPDPKPGQLEIIDISNWDTLIHNGLVTLSSDFKLTCWKPGIYYIPPIIFRFQQDKKLTQSKATNKLALLVDSPIADQIAADSIKLAPIKDIIEEPLKLQDFLPFIIGLATLAVLIFLGIFFYRRYKNKGRFEKIRTRNKPAHEVAIEKLTQLKGAKLWQQGMIKEYQSELSYIIREYVENRYEILALESTTDEIFDDLKEKDFDESLKDNLKEMLQLADLVKFAKAEPPVERHEQLMQFAEDFVLKTKKEVVESEIYDEVLVKIEPNISPELSFTDSSGSPENNNLKPKFQYANFWQRLLAHSIDINVFQFSFIAVWFLVAMILRIDSPSIAVSLLIVVTIVTSYILYAFYYFAYMEAKKGHTFGKKIMKIQVVGYDGENINMTSAILRFIVKFISFGFFFLPYITIFFTKKKQTPHDMAAKSLIIKRMKKEQLDEILDI